MKFSQLNQEIEQTRRAHEAIVGLIEHVVTELDSATEQLLRLHNEALDITDVHGSTVDARMWAECVNHLGSQLAGARLALVREIVDYSQSKQVYALAAKRPLRPVH